METALIISIVSIVFTGLFGLWNLKITVESHRMRKDEFYRDKKKYLQDEYDKRPKLDVISYMKNMDMFGYKPQENEVDCLVVPIINYQKVNKIRNFTYESKVANNNEWVNIQFSLVNNGKTAIKELYFAWNSPENTALFDVKNDEYIHYIGFGAINYRVAYFDEIKPGQDISLKINFHKDLVFSKLLSAEASFWLIDTYGNTWEQPLFVHQGKIYDSKQKTYREFNDYTNWKEIIKCFDNPELW
jgi:hypothetical protein